MKKAMFFDVVYSLIFLRFRFHFRFVYIGP